MAIFITPTQGGGDPTPALPNVEGANVPNVTTQPGPLPGTPQVNPNENPYASAPFIAQAKLGQDVGDLANKAEDYIQNVIASNQAMAVDTARTKYNTLQMKSVNDINARARTEGWSTDLDRVQQEYQAAHDENWAQTVGAIKISNPEVRRMAARLNMATADQNSRQANEFGLGEVQSGARNSLQTQITQFGDQLSIDSQAQPGDTIESYGARVANAAQAYQQKVAALQQDPHFAALLPAGELQASTLANSRKTLSEWLIGQRLALNDPKTFASGYGTDAKANDLTEQSIKDAYANIVTASGVDGPLGDVYKGDFNKYADTTRDKMENDAITQVENQQKAAEQQWNIKLADMETKFTVDGYNNVLSAGEVISSRDKVLAGIGTDPTLNNDQKRLLIDHVTTSFTKMAGELRKQQQEIVTRNAQIQAGVSLGNEADINKHYSTILQQHPELNGVSPGNMTPIQQQTIVPLIANTYNGQLPKDLLTGIEGDISSQDPKRMAAASNFYQLLVQTNKTGGLSKLNPTTQFAMQLLNQKTPIDQVQEYLKRVNTQDPQMRAINNSDYRKQVESLSSGMTGSSLAQKNYKQYQPFYVAAGVTGTPSQPLPAAIQDEADVITQNILASVPGIKLKDAQQQAAHIMQAQGLGMSSLNGGDKPTPSLRSAEQVAGTDSNTLSADITHAYSTVGENIPKDAKLIVRPTSDIMMNSNGYPMTRMEVQYVDPADGSIKTPVHSYYWDPQHNVAADSITAVRTYNATLGEYNNLVDKRARSQGLESQHGAPGEPATYGKTEGYDENTGTPIFESRYAQGTPLREHSFLGRVFTHQDTAPTGLSDVDSVAQKNIRGFQPDLWQQAKKNLQNRGQ